MTHNHVYNRADHGEPHPRGLPWVFECGGEDNFFATEEEACTAQRDWRRQNGLDEMTGETEAITYGGPPR